MRFTTSDPRSKNNEMPDGFLVKMKINFTGNAINYLSAFQSRSAIDLKEWIWHEQVINGERYYIITDKVNTEIIN